MAGLSAGISALETVAKIPSIGIRATLISIILVVALYTLLFAGHISGGFPSPVLYGLIAMANLLFYVLYLLTGIAVLAWIYRANANLRDAGMEDLKYSPAWAVVCWIIPIISLFMPFLTMRALYNRSHGEDVWNQDASVDAITSWWVCYIVGGLILAFTSLTFAINALPGVWVTTPPAADTGLNIAAYLLMAGSAWLLLKIIRAITDAQRQGMNLATVFE